MNREKEKEKTNNDEKQKRTGELKDEDEDMAKLLEKNVDKEDKLFTSRVNLFLVAESLLFVSYATLLTVNNLNKYNILIMGFLGIAITIIYWFILIRHVINISKLKYKLEDIYPNYRRMKREIMIKGYANSLLGDILPVIFLIAWIALLVVNCH